jgi:hypothetical protein
MEEREVIFFYFIPDTTRDDRIRIEYIRGSLKVAPVSEKMRSNRLAWYGHVIRRDESHITKIVMSMNVDRPRKRWMDCVKDDMNIKGVSMEMPTPHSGIRGR